MAVIETWYNQDLQQPVKVHYLDGNVFSQDNNGNRVGVVLYADGEETNVVGSISANVIRSDGATVAVSGSSSGNKAWVDLPQEAYAVPGVISIVIKATSGTDIATLCAVVATVYQSSTDTVIDPGTIIPSVQDLIDAIDAAVASIPADYSSLWTSLAPPFSSSSDYVPGQYVTYNGGVYRFNVAHSGSWVAGDAVAVNIGGELRALSLPVSEFKPLQFESVYAYNFNGSPTNVSISPYSDSLNDSIISGSASAGSGSIYAAVCKIANGQEAFSISNDATAGTVIHTGKICVLDIVTDYKKGFIMNIGFSTGNSWSTNQTSVEYSNIYIRKSGLYIFGQDGKVFRKAANKVSMQYAYAVYSNHGDSIPSALATSIKNGNTRFSVSFFDASAYAKIITTAQNNINSPFDSMSFVDAVIYNMSNSNNAYSLLGDFRKEAVFSEIYKLSAGTGQQKALMLKTSEVFFETTEAISSGASVDLDFDAIITVPNNTYGTFRIIDNTATLGWGNTYYFNKSFYLSPGTHIVHCNGMTASANIPAGTKFDHIAFNNEQASSAFKFDDISIAFTKSNIITERLLADQTLINNSGQLMPDMSAPIVYNNSEYATVTVSADYRNRIITSLVRSDVQNLGIRIGHIRREDMSKNLVVKIVSTGDVAVKGIYLSQYNDSWGGTRVGIENFTVHEGTSFYTINDIESLTLDGYLWIHLSETATTEQTLTIGYMLAVPSVAEKVLNASGNHVNMSDYTWNAAGDSITQQGRYMTAVHNLNNINVVNCGLSSSTIAINNTYLQNSSIVERVCGLNGNTPYSDADVWTVMGGLNDVLYRSALGSLAETGSTFDNTTVYGALQSICENILSRRPHPRMILVTPTQSVRDSWSKATYGITIAEIRQAVIDVANYYSIPVFDAWALSGVNHYNMERGTNPTTSDGVHLTDLGAELLAVPMSHEIESQY